MFQIEIKLLIGFEKSSDYKEGQIFIAWCECYIEFNSFLNFNGFNVNFVHGIFFFDFSELNTKCD